MHEFSIMTQMVASILEQTSSQPGLLSIEEVKLEVGELTFLNDEQLRFSFKVLAEKEPLLQGAKLVVENRRAKARCMSCGYEGGLEYVEEEGYHLSLPIFSCPKCGEPVEILEGKECAIVNVRAKVDDDVCKEDGGGEG